MTIAGAGCGAGFGGARAYTPSAAPGIFEWYLATADPAVLVPCAQPVIVNGDFETGDTTGWAAYGTASLAADATTPYAGTYCGKSTGSALNDGFFRSEVAGRGGIVGNRNCTTGVAAGDGTCQPGILLDGYTVDWLGTTSAAWQAFSAEKTLQAIDYGLLLVDRSGAAGFTRWDNVAEVNLSRSKWYAQDGVNFVANATAVQQPWLSSVGEKPTVYFNTGDGMSSGRAAVDWKFLHYHAGGAYDAPVFTATFRINIPTLSTNHMLWSTVGPGCQCYVTSAGAVKVEITDAGSGLIHPTCASANGVITDGATALVTVTSDGTDIIVRVDGVQVQTVAFDSAAANADPPATLCVGAQSPGTLALIGHMLGGGFTTTCLSGADLAKWEAYWSAI